MQPGFHSGVVTRLNSQPTQRNAILEEEIKRLKEDHERASFLANALNPYHSKKNGKDLQNFTNMVFFEPIEKKGSDLFSFLKSRGIIISKPCPLTRLVMHLNITDEILNNFIKTVKEFYGD